MSYLATAVLWLVAADGAPPTVDFRRDIYPILKNVCFDCHQGRRASSGVRLDLRADILGETNGKPLVALGKSGQSRLIDMVRGKVPGKIMPKTGPRLTETQIKLLQAWIDQGLTWDDRLLPPESVVTDHWAFQPVKRPPLPTVRHQAWVNNPIDAFILARLEEQGLAPAAPADPRTLIRRMSFDMIGLPPGAEEVEQFVRAADANAKRQAAHVERLLASPHYGERWGRHWLDVVRWAESEGYESNHLRPFAWRYRDWVVRSFNADKPFADFVREQLAGDEITPYADENVIATGFLAAARLSSNEEDRYRQRNDVLIDVVNATASALLGLTMQCAQCHNHKFDALTARDYYRFQGFFVKGQPGNLALRDPVLWREYNVKRPAGFDTALAERDRLFEAARQRKFAEVRKSLAPEALTAYGLTMAERSAQQEKLAREADLLFQFTANQIENALTADERKRYNDAKKQVAELEKGMLDKPQTFGFYSPATSPHAVDVLPMKGFYPLSYEPAELKRAQPYLLAAGDVHQPSFALDPGWPALFGPTPGAAAQDRPRLRLAEWLTDPRHPLAARVYVNRIWQQHFGRGIVATANDFGIKGAAPTHPELLDWLAAEFIQSGGSTRHLHRLILTSNTYRQSARASSETLERDPDNLLWSRWQPRRLEAEAIRDGMLAVSGDLDAQVGGPSIAPDDKVVRRSLYLLQKRDNPPSPQGLFDGPATMTESCAARQVTTVPLQSLYLLNSKFSMERARGLARRVQQIAGDDWRRQVDAAFRLALQRLPAEHERDLARQFFERQGSQETMDGVPMALVQFCQALMNVNEFVYME
jgi:hypothetical protein